MAKQKMVTRTIETTEATCLCVDLVNSEVFPETITLSGTFKNDEAILKQVKKVFDNDEHKAVSVSKVEVKENLYGMPEADFVAMAEILPPRSAAVAENE